MHVELILHWEEMVLLGWPRRVSVRSRLKEGKFSLKSQSRDRSKKIREKTVMSRHMRSQSKKQDAPGQIAIVGIHPVRVVLGQARVSEVWIREGASEHRLRI